jgi:predicted transposase YbfD/YdcC
MATGFSATPAERSTCLARPLNQIVVGQIVEVITSSTTLKGKRDIACHRFITSLRTTPDALLRLIRQRWSIENEWHWVRDTQLGEDAHRYANRTGVGVFSFLRTVVM